MLSMASPAFNTFFNPSSPRMRVALWLSGLLLPRRRGAWYPYCAARVVMGRVEGEGCVLVCPHHWAPRGQP